MLCVSWYLWFEQRLSFHLQGEGGSVEQGGGRSDAASLSAVVDGVFSETFSLEIA